MCICNINHNPAELDIKRERERERETSKQTSVVINGYKRNSLGRGGHDI